MTDGACHLAFATACALARVRCAGAIPWARCVARHRLAARHQLRACASGGARPSERHFVLSPDERTTYSVGYALGSDARAADVVLLSGDLGAGKTAFARGYVHAATRDSGVQVTSPTFLLTNTYASPGRPTVYHMDLWRLDDARSRPIVDFDHVFSTAVALVEWPDRLKSLRPPRFLDVCIEYPHSSTDSNGKVSGSERTADKKKEEKEKDDDEDDPWGFGEVDQEDISKSLRYIRFEGHGDAWVQRVHEFYERFTSVDEEGNVVLDSNSLTSSG